MKAYDLSRAAERDLEEIIRFTFHRWGATQVGKYHQQLIGRLEDIASGILTGKRFSEKLPDVLVIHAQRHFIFYQIADRTRPLILAILHEKQDLVARSALYPHLVLDKRVPARYCAGHVGTEPDQTHVESSREPGACQRTAAG